MVITEGTTEKAFENNFEGSDRMSPRETIELKKNCEETE